MNGRIGAGRTAAGPGRAAAAVAALSLGVLGVVAGSATASGLGAPDRTAVAGVGQAAAVAPGSTCTGEVLDHDFAQVRHGHVRGTMRAV